jgi:RNA polymerase sigma-70 factor (ECF subfamily)
MNPDGVATDARPDEELVKAVRTGDEDALSMLYRRYVAGIYRFAMAQVRDRDDAEDLTSETFARMLRGLAGFRGEASFKNWLYQIARNAIRNHRRDVGYRRTIALAPEVTEPDTPVVDLAAADRALAILRPLPPRYRQVLELRFLAGRSIEETAAAMGISEANAKVLQHRALRKAALIPLHSEPSQVEPLRGAP